MAELLLVKMNTQQTPNLFKCQQCFQTTVMTSAAMCIMCMYLGCRHSSVDLSAPSILPPRVRVPSTQSNLLSIYIWIVSCGKDENKQKEAGIGPFLKKRIPDALLFGSRVLLKQTRSKKLNSVVFFKQNEYELYKFLANELFNIYLVTFVQSMVSSCRSQL